MNYETIRIEVLQAIKKANALGLIHGHCNSGFLWKTIGRTLYSFQ